MSAVNSSYIAPVIDNKNKKKISTLGGQKGKNQGQFRHPRAVCVDEEDNVIIADTYNHRIQIFTKNGDFIRMFGSQGQGEGQFNTPYAVCVGKGDKSHLILIADFNNHRIQMVTKEGLFVKPIRCVHPSGVCVNMLLTTSSFLNTPIIELLCLTGMVTSCGHLDLREVLMAN